MTPPASTVHPGKISTGRQPPVPRSLPTAIRWLQRLAVLLVAALLSAGCINVDPPVSKVVDAVDDAITRVAANLTDWRTTLDELNTTVANIDDDAAKLIKAELQQLTERSIAAVGTEFRCNVDFLGQRVLEGLNRIKSALGGKTGLPVTPRFCSVSPGSIDMVLDPERRNKIEVTGYNFDAQPGMQLFLTTAAGRIDVTKHLTRQTHYKATINLGGSNADQGIQLDDTSRTLELTWQGSAFAPTVPVVQPPPLPKCRQQVLTSQPASYTVQAKHIGPGDADVFGKGDVTIQVWREGDESVVTARVYFKVSQYDDDRSTGEATSPAIELFRAPPGTKIVSVAAPEREAPDVYRDTDWEDDEIGGGGGLVRKYIVRADGNGDDLNGWAQVNVKFNSFSVAVVPTRGCVL